jgi:hypothetical protein
VSQSTRESRSFDSKKRRISHGSLMSTRRRPKRIASIDQEPGPSIATATLIERRRMAGSGAILPTSNSHDSDITAIRQFIGVQSPISISSPAPIPTLAGVIASQRAPCTSLAVPWLSNIPLAARRRISRPLPGQPFGNMEKRRCTQIVLQCRLSSQSQIGNTNKSHLAATLSGI